MRHAELILLIALTLLPIVTIAGMIAQFMGWAK
jgi:hypothetical protein